MASESAYSTPAAIGVGFALILAMITNLLFLFSRLNYSSATEKMKRLTPVASILYSIVALLMIFSPWLIGSDSSQFFSAIFFQKIAAQSIALSVFCGGVYVYTAGLLFFVRMIFFKRRTR